MPCKSFLKIFSPVRKDAILKKEINWNKLKVIHLNDSKYNLKSKKD
jgi:endonuclease IV